MRVHTYLLIKLLSALFHPLVILINQDLCSDQMEAGEWGNLRWVDLSMLQPGNGSRNLRITIRRNTGFGIYWYRHTQAYLYMGTLSALRLLGKQMFIHLHSRGPHPEPVKLEGRVGSNLQPRELTRAPRYSSDGEQPAACLLRLV